MNAELMRLSNSANFQALGTTILDLSVEAYMNAHLANKRINTPAIKEKVIKKRK